MVARLHLALRGGHHPRVPIGEALHPVALLAAAVLVVNDWVLKPSPSSPAWLTGKLSDVAGLAFAPVALTATIGLVLWIVRVRDPWLTRRRLVAAIVATGGVFAALKLSPALATWVATTWGRIAPGAAIYPDPTDLVALPALAIAYWIGVAELRWITPRTRLPSAPARTPSSRRGR